MQPTPKELQAPLKIHTNAEAMEVVKAVVPPFRDLWNMHEAKADDGLPHLLMCSTVEERLGILMLRLMEKQTRVYKRARWTLFVTLTRHLSSLFREIQSDFEHQLNMRKLLDEQVKRRRRNIMNGDGDGI